MKSALHHSLMRPLAAETAAYLAAGVAAGAAMPSSIHQARLDRLVRALKGAGVLALLDAFYLLAQPGRALAKVNLVAPSSYVLTENGTLAFTTNQGFTGDGATGYLDTGFNPAIAGGHYALGSACLGAALLTAGSSNSAIGNTNAFIDATASGVAARANGTTTETASAPVTFPSLTMWSRQAATSYSIYLDGALLATESIGAAAISNANFWLCGRNTGAGFFSTKKIGAAFFGAGLSPAQVGSVDEALAIYFVQLGVAL